MKNIISTKQMAEILEIGIKTNTNMLFIGGKGIGKTSIPRQVCAKLSRKLVEIRAAYSEAADFKGFPDKSGDDMVFLRPEDLPKVTDTGAVLFFDEINRAKTETMNCLMQASDGSGKVGTHRLPDQLTVIGAMNPDNDNYSVNFLDAALLNRFAIFYVSADLDQLVGYGRSKQWNENVLSFLQMKGTGLISEKISGNDIDAECSPRSLEKLSVLESSQLLQNKEMHALFSKAIIGCGAGEEYHAFTYSQAPITWEQLSSGKYWDRLEQYVNTNGVCRADLLSATNTNITEHFKSKQKSNIKSLIDAKEAKTLSTYLLKLNPDLGTSLLKNLIYIDTQEFRKFIEQNKEIEKHIETIL